MKYTGIAVLLFFLVASRVEAQWSSNNAFLGVQVVDKQLEIKKRMRLPNFILSQCKSRTVKLSRSFRLGADASYSRNVQPGLRGEETLSDQLYGAIPVYISFVMAKRWFIEAGGYGGLILKSSDKRPVIWGRYVIPSYVALDPDAGAIACAGLQFNRWGKLRIRYMYGLVKVAPWPGDTPINNRRLEVGLVLDM